MAFRIITADERLSAAENKTSLAIFGPPGVGKTTPGGPKMARDVLFSAVESRSSAVMMRKAMGFSGSCVQGARRRG